MPFDQVRTMTRQPSAPKIKNFAPDHKSFSGFSPQSDRKIVHVAAEIIRN
jgi:hypothetical protein